MSETTRDRPRALETAADLDRLVAERDRVLVEFHTEGCSMCDAMQPVLGNVARATDDLAVATMNPRDDPVLVERFDVQSVPMLLLFEGGELVGTKAEGFVPTEAVLAFADGED